jgi:hypothetical protein
MTHQDTDPVTWLEFRKLIAYTKKLEARLGDAFEAISTGDETQAEFWNEHEEKINRHQRSLRRLEKRMTELESE